MPHRNNLPTSTNIYQYSHFSPPIISNVHQPTPTIFSANKQNHQYLPISTNIHIFQSLKSDGATERETVSPNPIENTYKENCTMLKQGCFLVVDLIHHYWMASLLVWNVLERFGMFWNVLEWLGCFWNVLECLGCFWNVLGCFGMFLECFGMFWNVLGWFNPTLLNSLPAGWSLKPHKMNH